ncbi:MAG TPA: AbrB/MazE/SpoVT family DNA-binding domain-containing protein [Thermoanaerobaculia bacterium]
MKAAQQIVRIVEARDGRGPACVASTRLHYPGTVPFMIIATSRLTAQGQISVPKEVRRRLGLGPGEFLEWEEDGDRIVVRRAGRHSSEEIHRTLFSAAPAPRPSAELKQGIVRHVKERHARR